MFTFQTRRPYPAPIQTKQREDIIKYTETIEELQATKSITIRRENKKNLIKSNKSEGNHKKKDAESKLRRLRQRVTASRLQREKKMIKLEKAGTIDPSLLPRALPGRPRLTEQLTGLLQAIVSIAMANETRVTADRR